MIRLNAIRPSAASRRALAGVSLFAIAAMAMPAAAQDAPPAAAQDAPAAAEPTAEEIVVTGIRASLANAARDKEKADQIKDVISAEDIGKLPDTNVAEAMQRITGVQINRDLGEGSERCCRTRSPHEQHTKRKRASRVARPSRSPRCYFCPGGSGGGGGGGGGAPGLPALVAFASGWLTVFSLPPQPASEMARAPSTRVAKSLRIIRRKPRV